MFKHILEHLFVTQLTFIFRTSFNITIIMIPDTTFGPLYLKEGTGPRTGTGTGTGSVRSGGTGTTLFHVMYIVTLLDILKSIIQATGTRLSVYFSAYVMSLYN
jgi:hypothetical protein